MGTPDKPLRVTVVQPSLAKYRVPVFRELAGRQGIQLRVLYGTRDGLPNVEADGFDAQASRFWTPGIGGQHLIVHPAQWSAATRRETDVLVLNWTPRYVTEPPALLRAKWQGIPTVLWGHGLSKSDRWWWRTARKALGRLGSCLVFYDADTAGKFRNAGWDKTGIFVAPNAIDHQEIEQTRRAWLDAPQRLQQFQIEQGIHDAPVVLFVSRLEPKNRVELLVRATATVAQDWPTVKTVIIGNGDAERARLAGLAADLGVSQHVILKDGIYNESELAPWFLSAKVFCYPENIGLSILHSFWYGVPVVTSGRRECHNPEIAALNDGTNGMTYEHGQVDSLAETLGRLLADESLLTQMSAAARATVVDRYTIPKMVDGLESAIRFAANGAPQRTEPK